MWEVIGTKLENPSILGSFEPIEILDEYDEPLIFTSRDAAGGLLLAHNLASSDVALRYLVVVFDEMLLNRYKQGLIDVLGSLRQPRSWVVDLSHDGEIHNAWMVKLADLPLDVLPKRGVMLYPHLEPLFRIRLVGPQLGEGKTSSSGLRHTTIKTEDALKRVAKIVSEREQHSGGTAVSLRRYSDLGLQAMVATNLELAFASPPAASETERQTDTKVLHQMGQLLSAGIAAANGDPTDLNASGLSLKSRVSLLKAIKGLSPSKESEIRKIFVSGLLFGSRRKPQLLTRKSSRTVRDLIRSLR